MQYFTLEVTSFKKLHFCQIFTLYVVSQQRKEWNNLNQKKKKHHSKAKDVVLNRNNLLATCFLSRRCVWKIMETALLLYLTENKLLTKAEFINSIYTANLYYQVEFFL